MNASANPLFEQPLSEVSRKDRRALLALSTAGILMTKAGFLPTEVSALGIKFEPSETSSLMAALGAIVLYFLCSFVLRAGVDFFSRFQAIRETVVPLAIERKKRIAELEERYEDLGGEWALSGIDESGETRARARQEMDELEEMLFELRRVDTFERMTSARAVIVARSLFEFWIPIGVGVLACYLLFASAFPVANPAWELAPHATHATD